LYPSVSSPGATGGVPSVPALTIPYDVWTHIAVVRDKESSNAYFYMNGELVHTVNNAAFGNDLNYASIPASNKEIGIGKDGRTAGNRRLGASLANVAVLGTVRSQAEIQADMAAMLAG